MQRAGGLGMGNHPGQLGRHGHQKGFFAFIKAPLTGLLNNQHTQQPAVVNNGSTQEGAITLLPGLFQITELRM